MSQRSTPSSGPFAHRNVHGAGNRAELEEARPVACDVVIDQRLLRTDLPVVEAALARRSRPDAARRRAPRRPPRRATALDHAGARRHPGPGQRASPRRSGRFAATGDVDSRRGAAGREPGARRRPKGAGRRARRGRRPRCADSCSASPTCRTRTPPTARARTTTRSSPGRSACSTRYPDHQRVPHWETATALGILDNERAVKISGAMFTMQRGAGATLSRALCQYGLDLNADAFEEIRPPSLVSTATLTATGQLPKFADDAYSIERDDLWCIPTAEVPLTSIYAGEMLDDLAAPDPGDGLQRLVSGARPDRPAVTPAACCGSHEFDKVEILSFATPEQAPDLLVDMTGRAERAIAGLGLPYRIIEICTGDLGQSHHRSFDIEVYAPGADTWLEVSSISWFSDYQARRGNIRFRRHDADGKPLKGTEFVHTLNGSALAVPRVWAAIIENYRNDDGSVDRARRAAAVHARHHAASKRSSERSAMTVDDAGVPGHPVPRRRAPRPPRAVRDGRARRRRPGAGARRAVAALARRGPRRRRGRTERDDRRHDRCRRCAGRADRAGPRRRRAWAGVLHQLRRSQEPSTRRRPRSRRPCSPGSTCTARCRLRARVERVSAERERCLLRRRAPRRASSVPGRRRRAT